MQTHTHTTNHFVSVALISVLSSARCGVCRGCCALAQQVRRTRRRLTLRVANRASQLAQQRGPHARAQAQHPGYHVRQRALRSNVRAGLWQRLPAATKPAACTHPDGQHAAIMRHAMLRRALRLRQHCSARLGRRSKHGETAERCAMHAMRTSACRAQPAQRSMIAAPQTCPRLSLLRCCSRRAAALRLASSSSGRLGAQQRAHGSQHRRASQRGSGRGAAPRVSSSEVHTASTSSNASGRAPGAEAGGACILAARCAAVALSRTERTSPLCESTVQSTSASSTKRERSAAASSYDPPARTVTLSGGGGGNGACASDVASAASGVASAASGAATGSPSQAAAGCCSSSGTVSAYQYSVWQSRPARCSACGESHAALRKAA